jgi:hypothetical protein
LGNYIREARFATSATSEHSGGRVIRHAI